MAHQGSKSPSEEEHKPKLSANESMDIDMSLRQESGAQVENLEPTKVPMVSSQPVNWNTGVRPMIRTTLGTKQPLNSPRISSGTQTPVDVPNVQSVNATEHNSNSSRIAQDDSNGELGTHVPSETGGNGKPERIGGIETSKKGPSRSNTLRDWLRPKVPAEVQVGGSGKQADGSNYAEARHESESEQDSSDYEDDKGVVLNLVTNDSSELESGEVSEGSAAAQDDSLDEGEITEGSLNGKKEEDESEQSDGSYEPPGFDEEDNDAMMQYADSSAVGKHHSSNFISNNTITSDKTMSTNKISLSTSTKTMQPPLPKEHPPYRPLADVYAAALAAKYAEGQACEHPTTLGHLGYADLKKQLKLFWYHTTPDQVPLTAPIICPSCRQRGHLDSEYSPCTSHTCTHCGAFKSHPSRLCPSFPICQRCRQRGHVTASCPSPLKSTVDNVPCHLCGRPGHWEQNCESVWRAAPYPWESDVSARELARLACYECGRAGHLGNDCSSRRPGKGMGSSTWSALKGALPHPTSGREAPAGSSEWNEGKSLAGPSGYGIDAGRRVAMEEGPPGGRGKRLRKKKNGPGGKGKPIEISDDSDDDAISKVSRGIKPGATREKNSNKASGGKIKIAVPDTSGGNDSHGPKSGRGGRRGRPPGSGRRGGSASGSGRGGKRQGGSPPSFEPVGRFERRSSEGGPNRGRSRSPPRRRGRGGRGGRGDSSEQRSFPITSVFGARGGKRFRP